jgi:hypothetical protein
MSRQQTEITRLLKVLYPDIQSEITLNKITGNLLHKGIRVDIWIPSINLILEINGIQHFKPSGFGKNKIESHIAYINQCNRDSRLKDICKQFNINYEQIDYDEKHNISSLFKKFECYKEINNE